MKMSKNIMLIDDNKIDLFVSQKIIEKFNAEFKVQMFKSAMLAINYLKELELNMNFESINTVPNVIFLDINMPQINGFQFLDEIHKLNFMHNNSIEIYMLSSSSCIQDINNAKGKGLCSGYINKPLTIEKLKSVMVNV